MDDDREAEYTPVTAASLWVPFPRSWPVAAPTGTRAPGTM